MKKEDEDDEDTMKQSVLFMGERGHGTRLVRACVRHAPALRPHMKYNRDFSSNYTGGSLSLSFPRLFLPLPVFQIPRYREASALILMRSLRKSASVS